MDFMGLALGLLPDGLYKPEAVRAYMPAEEIRLRAGRCATVLSCGAEHDMGGRAVTAHDILAVLEKATGASLHAVLNELREGYISYRGIRIGVCAAAVIKNGEVSGFKNFTSLALRIPAVFRGDMDAAFSAVAASGFASTLLLSPPGGGKTTALRELVRRASEAGARVGVVDERNELASVDGMNAAFDMGRYTDVLTGVDKCTGAMMLLRGMNPRIIAMDEISRASDAAAVREITGCGVHIFATAHAENAAGLRKRALYRELLDEGIFSFAIEISGAGPHRSYRCVRLGI